MPAAPTTIRCHLLRKAEAADASTYGTGVSTRIITPMSWTSPPKALVTKAWPNSWRALMTGNASHSSSRFCGARSRSTMFWVRSSQGGGGRPVGLDRVGRMELAQELDALVLGRRVVTQALTGRLPDLVDRPPSVHEPDDHVRGGREAMEALARQVLEHVPRLAPVLMGLDPRVTPQAWGERRHPVP